MHWSPSGLRARVRQSYTQTICHSTPTENRPHFADEDTGSEASPFPCPSVLLSFLKPCAFSEVGLKCHPFPKPPATPTGLPPPVPSLRWPGLGMRAAWRWHLTTRGSPRKSQPPCQGQRGPALYPLQRPKVPQAPVPDPPLPQILPFPRPRRQLADTKAHRIDRQLSPGRSEQPWEQAA